MVVVVRGSSSSGGGGSRRSGFWETKLRKLNTREERERRGKWREPFFFFARSEFFRLDSMSRPLTLGLMVP